MPGLEASVFSKLLSDVFTIQGISTVLVLVLALQFLKKLLFPSDLAKLPGPRVWPFPLCSIMYFISVRRHGGVHNLEQYSYHKYGKLCRLLDPAGGDKVLVADPEIVKQILVKEFHKFPDRGMPIKLVPPLNAELFLSKYPRWKRMRKVLSPTFSAARLKQVVPLISVACERLEAKVEKLADTGESVDVPKLSALFVLDVILSANFGVETKDIQTNTNEEFFCIVRSECLVDRFWRPSWAFSLSLLPLWEGLLTSLEMLGCSLRCRKR
ncbi:cytochrome P450 3A21-like isoform X1 [Oculina patagonica]